MELIPQSKPEPKTRDISAKAAGTNPKYIDLADKRLHDDPLHLLHHDGAATAGRAEAGRGARRGVDDHLHRLDADLHGDGDERATASNIDTG